MFKISPGGKIESVDWSKPKNVELETVLPDGKGGLFLVSSDAVLYRTPKGTVRTHANAGSRAGAVALAGDGTLFLGRGDHIDKVSPDGKTVTRVAFGFRDVFGLALNAEGELYASDRDAGKVYRVEGGRKRVIASGLSYPSGLVCDDAGNVYVKESGRKTHADMRIRLIKRDGTIVVFATVPTVSRQR